MSYKKGSQPLKEHSAGCCFKNPELPADLDGVGSAGQRVSAGLLLDRAGCKGMAQGGASVSEVHANFVVVGPGATAQDVIALMERMAQRVHDAFGVTLHREVVVWERGR
jgi:UDP-N-acetylmuramate dehydrogenase